MKSVLPQSNENFDATKRQASWQTVSRLQIGDVIGVGILAIGAGYAQFGWVLSILFTVGFLPMTIYFAILLWEARNEYPECTTMTEMANATVKNKWFTGFVAFSVYALLALILGVYIGSLADALQGVFYDTSICRYQWGLIAGLALIPFSQIQTLNGTRWLLILNNACIVITVMMVVGYAIYDMSLNGTTGETSVWPSPTLSWQGVFGGLSTFVFAYNGMIIYLEFMAEMKEPKDWPKTFSISGPFQVGLYAVVGITGYIYKGSSILNGSGNLVDVIPHGAYYRIVQLMLFTYMYIAYLIKSTILTQVLSEVTLKAFGKNAISPNRLRWFAFSMLTLLISYILGMMVPIFSQLISIAGSLFVPLTGIHYPIIFVYYARKTNGKTTHLFEKILVAVFFVGFTGFVIAGTAANLWTIIESYNSVSPFACPSI